MLMAVAVRVQAVVRGFNTSAGRQTALKSVLFRLLAGLDRPTAGSIQIGETLLHELSDRALTQWRRHGVGIVLQDHQLFDALSVLDNVQL
jgi:putative ABC transport system ATP-binding protein